MSRSTLSIILGALLFLILLAAAGGAFVWWKIAGLKEQLVRNLEAQMGARVQIGSVELRPWKGELRATDVSLVNDRPAAPWEKGDISQATVHFHLSDLLASTLPISVEVSSWNIVLRSPADGSPSPTPSPTPAPSPSPASAPPVIPDSAAPPSSSPEHGRVHVTNLLAQEGTAEIDLSGGKKVTVHGVAFQAMDNGGGIWTAELQAASVTAGSLEGGASSVEIRAGQGEVSFSTLRIQCAQGLVTGNGQVALDGDHAAKFTLKATDVPITMLVAVSWQMKLSGLVQGDLTYIGGDQGADAKGKIVVNQGKFNVLPALDKVAAIAGLQPISNVEVDTATSDFEWKDQTLHLTNLDVRKNDVMRIAGQVDINGSGQVDGRLKLGLPSNITGKWPQLQTQVFPVQMDEYNWAEVHLTGTPDHLQEDLTPRLLTAGLGQGSDLMHQAAQKATDLLNNFLGK